MKLGVFHPGTQHSWQTALALQQLGRLEFFATTIFYQPDRWPYRLERILPAPLGRRLHAEFQRFRFDALDPALVQTAGVAEWLAGHPDFFERHPELLEALSVPHLLPPGVASLVERQVLLLRARETATRRKLAQLIEIARDGDHLDWLWSALESAPGQTFHRAAS